MSDINSLIDYYSRYQKGLKMHHLFPTIKGKCACGCGAKLTGRKRRWASQECSDNAFEIFAIIKGNNDLIRKLVFQRDEGFCRYCGVYDPNWEADHIIEVRNGGGACGLDNIQTLCPNCHSEKTKQTSRVIQNTNDRLRIIPILVWIIENHRASHHKFIS